MKLLRTRAELISELEPLWQCAARISLIPTMGALHEGHLNLARLCGPCDIRVMSIFVNPTQFAPNEDLSRYPRDLERDLSLCEQEGLDFIYAPSADEMYGGASKIEIDPGMLGSIWEGKVRPTHFRGVLTVVGKLFHQVKPDAAVFGEKDFQQLILIRAMAEALDWPVAIIAGQIIREPDGLAMSSRNRFLKHAERSQATVLYRALRAGQEIIKNGESRLELVKNVMSEVVAGAPQVSVDYLTVVDSRTLKESAIIGPTGRLIGAIRIGSVRLIDNLPAIDASSELSTV
ncbi:MAG: pantoate--beta-alanine ligase [Calditrichaeota bacterium]|nr:pantoate--beta-alanine ligase [Calditrichota bacterium]MCB9368179.1 pantoate--beta-alanine ligase [Calditrichota bacterium]